MPPTPPYRVCCHAQTLGPPKSSQSIILPPLVHFSKWNTANLPVALWLRQKFTMTAWLVCRVVHLYMPHIYLPYMGLQPQSQLRILEWSPTAIFSLALTRGCHIASPIESFATGIKNLDQWKSFLIAWLLRSEALDCLILWEFKGQNIATPP